MTASAPELGFKSYSRFVAMVCIAHLFTYIVAGTLAYQLIYKSAIDLGGFDAYMRNENNPEEWQHVLTWLLPAQVLRGLLYGIALCPFLRALTVWKLSTRFWTLILLFVVFSAWCATMPAPGNIEGWLYLRPDSGPTLPDPLLGYIEVPLQLGFFSFLLSWRIGKQKMLVVT